MSAGFGRFGFLDVRRIARGLKCALVNDAQRREIQSIPRFQLHGTLAVATRFAFALAPLGFAMWVAHYGYHLVTGYDTAWPVTQRFAADRGWNALGEPEWVACCCRAVGDWLPKAQIVILELGLLLTLYTAYRVARDLAGRRVVRALAPWAVLSALSQAGSATSPTP